MNTRWLFSVTCSGERGSAPSQTPFSLALLGNLALIPTTVTEGNNQLIPTLPPPHHQNPQQHPPPGVPCAAFVTLRPSRLSAGDSPEARTGEEAAHRDFRSRVSAPGSLSTSEPWKQEGKGYGHRAQRLSIWPWCSPSSLQSLPCLPSLQRPQGPRS